MRWLCQKVMFVLGVLHKKEKRVGGTEQKKNAKRFTVVTGRVLCLVQRNRYRLLKSIESVRVRPALAGLYVAVRVSQRFERLETAVDACHRTYNPEPSSTLSWGHRKRWGWC